MTKNLLYLIVFVSFLYSCTEVTSEKQFTVKKTDNYIIDTVKSIIKWDRFVDNKLINKKIKLFGSYVDVKMENVTYNTSGNTPVIKGEITYIDNEFSSGNMEMDFSVCRFYSEEEEAFFIVKDFPPSLLKFTKLIADTINKGKYNIESLLTVRDSTRKISFPAEISKDSLNNIRITGNYVMQTLDWPIRENPDRNNIRKDEISFNFDLLFLHEKSVTDTIYAPEPNK